MMQKTIFTISYNFIAFIFVISYIIIKQARETCETERLENKMATAYDNWKNDFSEMYDVETVVCEDEDTLSLCEVCVARMMCESVGYCINMDEDRNATLEECLENIK